MDQPKLTPFPLGRYFTNLFGSDQISDWALAQFFHDAGRHYGGQAITVRVDPIMRDGQQHGWQLTAWTMREEELAANELRAENERLHQFRDLLANLQALEAEYRLAHDRHGDGSRQAGRAWDLMRRAGDEARAALGEAK